MYKSTVEIFKVYWTAYGGTAALLRSAYLHWALLLLVLTWKTWVEPQTIAGGGVAAWWDQSLSVLPNLLGFSLGGFAIFIGFGDEKFRQLLADPGSGKDVSISSNLYVKACATFVHFILVQALALMMAVIAKSWWFYSPFMNPVRDWLPIFNGMAGFFGYGLFLYALSCVVAATMHVFRLANMYAKFRGKVDSRRVTDSD